MTALYNQKSLVDKIEHLRNEMIKSGITEGLSSKKTIELSQLLDQYVLKYQQLIHHTKKSLN